MDFISSVQNRPNCLGLIPICGFPIREFQMGSHIHLLFPYTLIIMMVSLYALPSVRSLKNPLG